MSLKKLDTWLVVKTAVVWMMIAYTICAVGYLILPRETFDILWKPMFHALAMEPKITFIIVGFVEAVVYMAVLVWIFVALYNQFAKGKR